MQTRTLALCVALFSLGVAPVDQSQRLDDAIRPYAGASSTQAPAIGVAIAQGGAITYERGFGDANASTRFRIGSVTKMFTAVSIMQLVEQGKINLDAPVSTYLPQAPHTDKITVRELLNHTSGVWNYGDEVLASGDAQQATTPQGILDSTRIHNLNFTPGSKFQYSNTGYVMLGMIVESVAKMPLASYEKSHIYDPAGMTNTTMGNGDEPVVAGKATLAGYTWKPYDPSWFYADGDIVSTASDLVRFDLALQSGKLVKPSTFALMQKDPVDAAALGQYGLGVTINRAYGTQTIGHHGGLPDFSAENDMFPDKSLVVVVLSNTGSFATGSVVNAALRTILPPEASALPEDPALTTRFRSALSMLLHGSIDRSQYSADANAMLTQSLIDATAKQLGSLGDIVSMTYIATDSAPKGSRYTYDVKFANGMTMRWVFGLTSDGKISGLGSRG